MKQRPATADELFDDMLYSPLDWPGKTTRLRRDSVQDVRQRSASHAPGLGELFHENSKLYPAGIGELAASRFDTDTVRSGFLTRRGSGSRRAAAMGPEWFATVRPLLGAVAQQRRRLLFYALELRVSDGAWIAQYEPLTNELFPIKAIGRPEYEAVSQALQLIGPPRTQPAALVFVVASFVRNEVLYGARGYRRTLMEAGRLAEALVVQAELSSVELRPVFEYHDRVVDHFVEVDGVDAGTVLVLELGSVP